MKILIMSDGHGNLFYVERCLEDSRKYRGITEKVYLGDSFGYGRQGLEVMNLMRQNNFYCLLGNHEAMLLGLLPIKKSADKIYQLTRERKKISKNEVEFLHSLLPFYSIKINERKLLFVHGCPSNPLLGYQYEDTLGQLNHYQEYDAVFMGHTHRPFVKKKADVLHVNVGSCGLPRDIGNMPSYAVYDTEANLCSIERVAVKKDVIVNGYSEIHKKVKECMLRNIQNNE